MEMGGGGGVRFPGAQRGFSLLLGRGFLFSPFFPLFILRYQPRHPPPPHPQWWRAGVWGKPDLIDRKNKERKKGKRLTNRLYRWQWINTWGQISHGHAPARQKSRKQRSSRACGRWRGRVRSLWRGRGRVCRWVRRWRGRRGGAPLVGCLL